MTESTLVPDGTWTVNDTLQRYPATVQLFNQFGIDACCGGAASIIEASERDGADATALLDALRAAVTGPA